MPKKSAFLKFNFILTLHKDTRATVGNDGLLLLLSLPIEHSTFPWDSSNLMSRLSVLCIVGFAFLTSEDTIALLRHGRSLVISEEYRLPAVFLFCASSAHLTAVCANRPHPGSSLVLSFIHVMLIGPNV
jgi:hypothetical protein